MTKRRCHICNQNTWTVEDGCRPCRERRRDTRRITIAAVALLVALLVALAVVQLWAVDWDVKCWVSDKCRKVSP